MKPRRPSPTHVPNDVLTPAARTGINGNAPAEPSHMRRGRPKLGVVAREITLLPRQWAWLDAQPGSASITLRKLVEEQMGVRATGARS